MQKRYPFKFLDSYTAEDTSIFFGREEEIKKLYQMVFESDLILLYGKSGTGKSSLVQCGLAQRFQKHEWLPVSISRGSNLLRSFEQALEHVGGILEEESIIDLNEWIIEENGNIPTAIHQSPIAQRLRSIYLKHFRPIYLIFDQFEELYVLGDKKEQTEFIELVKLILKVEQPVKIILSIREEYLGHLYLFEKEVPDLLRKKLRIEPMNLEKVVQVVKKIGEAPHTNISLKAGQELKIGQQIFDKIKGDRPERTIPLPYLQVYLDRLYIHITGDNSRKQEADFSLEAINQLGTFLDILQDFLDRQVAQIALENELPAESIWKVLGPFVSLEGTKKPLSLSVLRSELKSYDAKLLNNIMENFVRARILRYREEEGLYEVVHDSLAKQIQKRRSDKDLGILQAKRILQNQLVLEETARVYLNENQLKLVNNHLADLELNQESRQFVQKSEQILEKKRLEKKNIRIAWATMIGVIALLPILLFVNLKTQNLNKKLEEKTDETVSKNDSLKLVNKEVIRARDSTETALSELSIQQDSTEKARQELSEVNQELSQQQVLTQSALEKAERLVNAFHFYDDKYALASTIRKDSLKYFFIDKEGKKISSLGEWDHVTSFNNYGFTLAYLKDDMFYLDTSKIAPISKEHESLYRNLYQYGDSLYIKDPSQLKLLEADLQFYSKAIKTLVLRTNELPKNFDLFYNLTVLNLQYNQLNALPDNFGYLNNLTELDLANNQLNALPDNFGYLNNLTKLDLTNNQLNALPDNFGYLNNLMLCLIFGYLNNLTEQ